MTSSKKIGNYEAYHIANEVSKKAMEHLIAPIEQRLYSLVLSCRDDMLSVMGTSVSDLVRVGIMGEENVVRARCVRKLQSVMPANEFSEGSITADYVDVLLESKDGETLFGGHHDVYIPAIVETTVHFDEVAELVTQLTQYVAARVKMQDELSEYLRGQSSRTVMKAWPEITPFVVSVLGLKDTPTLPVPFEQFMSKFLPALPAPAQEC